MSELTLSKVVLKDAVRIIQSKHPLAVDCFASKTNTVKSDGPVEYRSLGLLSVQSGGTSNERRDNAFCLSWLDSGSPQDGLELSDGLPMHDDVASAAMHVITHRQPKLALLCFAIFNFPRRQGDVTIWRANALGVSHGPPTTRPTVRMYARLTRRVSISGDHYPKRISPLASPFDGRCNSQSLQDHKQHGAIARMPVTF